MSTLFTLYHYLPFIIIHPLTFHHAVQLKCLPYLPFIIICPLSLFTLYHYLPFIIIYPLSLFTLYHYLPFIFPSR